MRSGSPRFPAVYLGGGVTDHLLEALAETPCAEALAQKIREGGMVVAIAAAAQVAGHAARSIAPGSLIPGLGWLPEGVVEPNSIRRTTGGCASCSRPPGCGGGSESPRSRRCCSAQTR